MKKIISAVALIFVVGIAYFLSIPRASIEKINVTKMLIPNAALSNQEIVAVNFKIKNMNHFEAEKIKNSDFNLINSNKQKMQQIVSQSDDKAKTYRSFKQMTLKPGQSEEISLVFVVEKSKSYQISYRASGLIPYSLSQNFNKGQIVDNSKSLIDLSKTYVNTVALGLDAEQPKNLENALAHERALCLSQNISDVQDLMSQTFGPIHIEFQGKNVLENDYLKLTKDEANSIVESLQKTFIPKGKITYTLDEVTPDYVSVKLTPTFSNNFGLSYYMGEAMSVLQSLQNEEKQHYNSIDDFYIDSMSTFTKLVNIEIQNTTGPGASPFTQHDEFNLIFTKARSGKWQVDGSNADILAGLTN